MAVYLLHFDRPYKHAKHYLGFARDVPAMHARIDKHYAASPGDGKGHRLMQVVRAAGISFTLARVWPDGTRADERSVDRNKEVRLMNVGFTGTRKGMSEAQSAQLRYLLALFKHADHAIGRRPVLHHGGCAGADMEASELALGAGYEEREHMPYAQEAKYLLARDREIVKACDVLVAAPHTDAEQVRSGTWYTVRQARRAGKPVVMLSRGA